MMQPPPTRPFPLAVALATALAAAAVQGRAPAQTPERGGSLVERGLPLQVVEPDPNDRDLRTTPIVRAVQRAADSVVSIYLQNQLAGNDADGRGVEGQGSGVLLDESGLAITNWHVVAPMLLADGRSPLGVVIKLRDGRQRPARVLSSSPGRDLALLQLQLESGEKVKPIEIARSADLMIGETVIAIGNPQGHANTVTSGVLSAINRSIQVRAPDGVVRRYTDLLQTDAAINQGNSGGALLDITGRLIGINNAMAVGAENIGFAIPTDVLRAEFQKELLQSDSFFAAANAPWLGLEVVERESGLVVTELTPDGPASRAGVVVGDTLEALGPHEVKTSLDYLRHFFEVRTDRPLELRLRRAGKPLRVEARPLARDQGVILTSIGAVVEEIDVRTDEALVKKATLAFYRGSHLRRVPLFPAVLRITEVVPGTPAHAIGLERDDVLLAIFARSPFGEREVPLTSRRDFARALEAHRGTSLRLAVLRGNDDLLGTIDVRGSSR
jgi:serine protease Do